MAVKIVKELGYEVEEARDGLEALNYLNKNSDIDIVLSDIEMPQMNGWELCENIKASKELSNLPVIALTTRFSPKDIEKGKEIGFDFYLEKMKKEDIAQALQKIEAIGA
jgi:two-component system chemotaxis sensor kinase CheA